MLAVAVLSASCGGGSDDGTAAPDAASATTPTTAAPTTAAPTTTAAEPVRTVVDARGTEVAIDSIERLIPLDGDVAEIVFALGMADHVVATDLSATYPPEADALPQIGYQRSLTAEPILGFEPTLLLATDIAGPPETLDALEGAGVPLVIVPDEPTRTGATDKILAIADALGVPEAGVELAESMDAEVAAALARASEELAGGGEPLLIGALYLRGPDVTLVLGTDYATDWLIEAVGGVNLADELGLTEAEPITAEAILAAEPDVLLVTDSGLESVGGADGLAETVPALARTPAAANGAILAYDDQLLLGNGPRVAELLDALIDDLTGMEFAQ